MLVKQCVSQKSTFALTTRSAAEQQGRQFVSIVRNYLVYWEAKLLPPCNKGKQSVKSKTNVFTILRRYKNCTRHSYTYIITSPPKGGLTPPSLTVEASRSNFCVVGQIYVHSLFLTVSFTLCTMTKKKLMIYVPNLKSKVSAQLN